MQLREIPPPFVQDVQPAAMMSWCPDSGRNPDKQPFLKSWNEPRSGSSGARRGVVGDVRLARGDELGREEHDARGGAPGQAGTCGGVL